MKRPELSLVCAFLSLLMLPFSAEAHKLSVFAYLEGDLLVGEAYSNRGDPAIDVPVTVTSGELLLARGSTDSKGRFSFSLQRASLKEIRVTVDAGMGHHAFQILHLEPVAEPVVSPSAAVQEGDCEKASDHLLLSSEMMREIVRGELEPLKNMLLSLRREQEKAGITEILGGIGYIFGIVGICMWYRGGRRSG